jgi:hypothetical protein
MTINREHVPSSNPMKVGLPQLGILLEKRLNGTVDELVVSSDNAFESGSSRTRRCARGPRRAQILNPCMGIELHDPPRQPGGSSKARWESRHREFGTKN